MPSVSTFGVSSNPAPVARTKPSSSRVSSSRRAVGRASPAAVATSDSDIVRWSTSKQARTSRPRASASTKSGPAPRPAIDGVLSPRRERRSRALSPPKACETADPAGQSGGSAADYPLLTAGALGLVLVLAVPVRVVQDLRLGARHVGEHALLPGLLA